MHSAFVVTRLFPVLVIIVMFGMGLSLTSDDFFRIARYPKAAIVGLTNQMLLLPLLALGLAWLLAPSPAIAVGLMVVAAVPGGTSSNAVTHLLRADTALSVTLTAVSSLMSFITTPLWIGLALAVFMKSDQAIKLPFGPVVLQIAVLTIVPAIVGMAVHTRWPGFVDRTREWFRIGSGLMVFVAILSFLIEQWAYLGQFLLQAGVLTTCLCTCAALLGYATARLGKLRDATRITITVETSIQNMPLALTIATSLLANPEIAITPAAYELNMILLILLIVVGVIFRWPIFQFASVEDK